MYIQDKDILNFDLVPKKMGLEIEFFWFKYSLINDQKKNFTHTLFITFTHFVALTKLFLSSTQG